MNSQTKISKRVVFVDQARAIAILLMLLGHSLDRFLGEPWRSGVTYRNYQFVRGISSSLFLTVAGFSFVIASFGHWQDYIHPSSRLWSRMRRVGLILFLGYTLQLFAPTLHQSVAQCGSVQWERFVRFDVLQNIAFGLGILHLVTYFGRTPERFFRIIFVLLLVVLGAAAITYRPEVDIALPIELRAMVNLYHYSRFPIVPYTAFIFVGALFGYQYWLRVQTGGEQSLVRRTVLIALLLILFELFIRKGIDGGVFPYSTPQRSMPGNTFARLGCSLLILSALYYLGRIRVILPRLAHILSKESLTIYFVHLFLVYGGAQVQGLFASRAQDMHPAEVLLWVAGLTTSMILMAKLIFEMRSFAPTRLARLRRTVILGSLLNFLFASHLVWWEVTLFMVLAALVVTHAESILRLFQNRITLRKLETR